MGVQSLKNKLLAMLHIGFVWLGLTLQCATVLRIAATLPTAFGHWLLLGAALPWLAIMAVWGLRLMGWFGRLRADGRAG